MNDARTNSDICAVAEPSPSEARRLRREAKAVEILQKMKVKRREPEAFPKLRDPVAGELVYFIYSAGRIKIGFTTDIYRRLNDLTNMGGAPLVLIGVLPGTVEFERSLHRIFKPDRLHGEWFRISDEIRRFLSCIDDAASVLMPPEVGSCLARLAEAEANSPPSP